MNMQHTLRVWALALAVVLAGCGGGGGGGGSGGPATTLSGNVSYDGVPNTNGALNYSATISKPVRGAGVDVVNTANGAVLASTTTDDNGNYSVQAPGQTFVTVRVRAQLARGGPGPNWDVTVRDNTQANALYSMESPSFSTGGGVTRDLHAPSGWGGSGYTGARVAGPFAILDTVYTAMNKVLSVAPSAAFPSLRVFWSVNNVPADGSDAAGQIGTTSFRSSSAGASIYVLGAEGVDTDEYDESVVAHEWGHYYQNAFSRDDSPGGPHDIDELLDQRLAFSEGWGNAWSGIALARRNYTDSVGPGQGRGVDMDLSAGAAAPQGWFREASVQSILWNLNRRFGFAGIHAAMSGGLRTTPTVTTIHAFAAAYAAATPGAQADLASLLVGQGISGALNDPWATQETNTQGVPGMPPIYLPVTAPGTVPGCVTVTSVNGQDNKLGSFAYLRVAVPTARVYQISVTGPGGSDPDIYVYAGGRLAASIGLGITETTSVGLPAGDVVLALNDANNTSPNTCLQVTIN